MKERNEGFINFNSETASKVTGVLKTFSPEIQAAFVEHRMEETPKSLLIHPEFLLSIIQDCDLIRRGYYVFTLEDKIIKFHKSAECSVSLDQSFVYIEISHEGWEGAGYTSVRFSTGSRPARIKIGESNGNLEIQTTHFNNDKIFFVSFDGQNGVTSILLEQPKKGITYSAYFPQDAREGRLNKVLQKGPLKINRRDKLRQTDVVSTLTPGNSTILLQRAEGEDLEDEIVSPLQVNINKVLQTLLDPLLLTDPINAPPELDKWRFTNIMDLFDITWIQKIRVPNKIFL